MIRGVCKLNCRYDAHQISIVCLNAVKLINICIKLDSNTSNSKMKRKTPDVIADGTQSERKKDKRKRLSIKSSSKLFVLSSKFEII